MPWPLLLGVPPEPDALLLVRRLLLVFILRLFRLDDDDEDATTLSASSSEESALFTRLAAEGRCIFEKIHSILHGPVLNSTLLY